VVERQYPTVRGQPGQGHCFHLPHCPNKFFGSDIRQKLETALATSRGQIRDIYVESYGGGQASVYSVIDQVYANNTNKTPQSDVLRVVVNLTQRPQGWKVSNVTVLEGGSST
jgi:hypothetical protein